MKIKHFLCAAALLCSCSLLLSSCGILLFNSPSEKEEDTTTVDTAPEPQISSFETIEHSYTSEINRFAKDLSGNTYSGAVVKIVTVKAPSILPDETVGATISKALETRNNSVENVLDISLSVEQADPQTMLDGILAAVRSDSFYADLIEFPQSYIGSFAVSGALLNLLALPGIKTDAQYFTASGVAAGTGGDTIYAVTGGAALNSDSLSAVYFNKNLCASLGLESPYTLVDNGQWTMDKYLEYTAALSSLDGGYYSYAAQNTSTYLTDLLFFAGGQQLTGSANGIFPYIAFSEDGTSDLLAKIAAILYDGRSVGNALNGISAFDEGSTLFLFDRLGTMETLAASGVEWGILPMPKYDEAQEEYYSLAYYEDALFFGAVPTVSDARRAAELLMTMNILSYGNIADAYVKHAAYTCLRDNDSIRMLDIIVANPVYDFAYSFADVQNAIPSATFMAIRNTVAGVSGLQRYLDMWGGQFESAMYRMFNVG